MKQELSIKI